MMKVFICPECGWHSFLKNVDFDNHALHIRNQSRFACGVEVVIVVYRVTVIVTVSYADLAVLIDSYIVAAVPYIKALDAPVGLHRPAKRAVLFLGVNDL